MIGGVLVNFLLALFIYAMCLFTWGEDYVRPKDMAQGMLFNKEAKALGFQDHYILVGTNLGEFKDAKADMYRLRAELVWLSRLLHLLGIHRLVNHTRYLAVATERKPTDAVGWITLLRLELEQTEPRVEEEVELLDTYAKEFREEEVSALMQKHEERDSQHKLERLYKKYFHLRVLSFEF